MKIGHFLVRTVSIVIICFFFAGLIRILFPAVLEVPDRKRKEETKREILVIWDCLTEYKNRAPDEKFPAALNRLGEDELAKRGLSDSAALSAKYWYLPNCSRQNDCEPVPLLIEKPGHYSRWDGGYVADSKGRIAYYYLGITYREFLQRYRNDVK